RDDARVLQSADVPRRRFSYSRHASRTGHAQDGQPAEVHAVHILDFSRRLAGDLRNHSVQRLLVKGRDTLERCLDYTNSAGLAGLVDRDDRSTLYGVLDDPPGGDDVRG